MATLVQSYGLQLVDRSGKDFDVQQLTASDVIALYFSAHWCPPCRGFTPLLKKFNDTLQSLGEQSLRIIFVSSDNSEKEMWQYMYESHGDWLALKYDCKELKDRLSRQFQVSGIPALIILDSLGRQAVKDARSEVMAAASASSTQILATLSGWKAAAGVAAQVDTSTQIPSGTSVRVRGLQGAPENNGLEGVVQSFDSSKRRYVVQIGERPLSLKAANLLQLLSLQVCRGEGEEPSEWIEAQVADFDDATGQYLCRLSKEADEVLPRDLRQPSQARLGVGAIVAVQGLQAGEWNEKNGKVTEFDEERQRYQVQVESGKALKIKPENIRLPGAWSLRLKVAMGTVMEERVKAMLGPSLKPEMKTMMQELGENFKFPEWKYRMNKLDSCSSEEASMFGGGAAFAPGGQSQGQASLTGTIPKQSLLHELVGIDRMEKVVKQLDKGTDINVLDCMGETPLFWAVSAEAVEYLVREGADIQHRNSICQCSAFYKFACQGSHKPLKALALHLRKAGVLEKYLDEPASITKRTPLHAAAHNGFLQTVKELLSMGADRDAQDYLGKTPLDLARDRGFNEAAPAQHGVALALLGCSALLDAFRL
ncbi:nxn [Symbiodinium sp. CCMP2456]|nr:nxn [Symbiodinium sp. CCMP2456]